MNDRAPRIHLSLRVRPDRLADVAGFYAQVFGTPPRKQHEDHVQFDLDDPPLNLTLVPSEGASRGELDHLGLQVFSADALERARQRLAAAGLALREQPDVDCCYARQSKFWVTDPEGREVEVFLKHADIERHGHGAPVGTGTPAATACCAGGGCG